MKKLKYIIQNSIHKAEQKYEEEENVSVNVKNKLPQLLVMQNKKHKVHFIKVKI